MSVQVLSGALVELAQNLVRAGVDLVVVERARHVAHVVDQAGQDLGVRAPAREALDRLPRHLPEVVVLLLATGHADHLESLRQRPFVGEVVERRQQLAVREVTGRAEDHERGRADGEALEPLDQRVVLFHLARDGRALHALSSSRQPQLSLTAADSAR